MIALFLLTTLAFAQSNVNCKSAYCSQCDATQCTNCITDFILQNGECVYCRDAVEHCKYALNGKCSECFYGYYAINGECKEMEEELAPRRRMLYDSRRGRDAVQLVVASVLL